MSEIAPPGYFELAPGEDERLRISLGEPAPPASGWIKCSERLPAPSQAFTPVIWSIDGSIGAQRADRINAVDQTHWFDLPAPPAPEKSEAELAWEALTWPVIPPPKDIFIAGFNAGKAAR